MKKLRQTLTAFAGAVVFLLSVPLTSSAQFPNQALHSGSGMNRSAFALLSYDATRSQNLNWTIDPTLITRLTAFDHLGRITGLSRSGHAAATSRETSEPLLFTVPRLSLEEVLASSAPWRRASTQTVPVPQISAFLPSKEQGNPSFAQRRTPSFNGKFKKFRGHQSPYPSGFSSLPPIPGLVQTPSIGRFQIGYELFSWQLKW